jgi:hypothetical protein
MYKKAHIMETFDLGIFHPKVVSVAELRDKY